MLIHQGSRPLESGRLLLRPFVPGDVRDMFHNWCSDPQVVRYLSWPYHQSIQTTDAVLHSWVEAQRQKNVYRWGIVLRTEGNHVVGCIDVVGANDSLLCAEIGYALSRRLWGQGIMTEALGLVLDYLFGCGYIRLCACHDVENPASGRVMEKAGMQFEGILRSARRTNRGFCDVAQYAILTTDPRPAIQAPPALAGAKIRYENPHERMLMK